MTTVSSEEMLGAGFGKFGSYERQGLNWAREEMRQQIEGFRVGRRMDGTIDPDRASPPPPGREIEWDEVRGAWDVDWSRDFGGAWTDERRKNEIRQKLEDRLGMSHAQAEYAVLFIALAGYSPRDDISVLEQGGVTPKSLDDILDSFNVSDPRWNRGDKKSTQFAFFEHYFSNMRKSDMRILFPKEYEDLEFDKQSFKNIEEFAMKLAFGGTQSKNPAAEIGKDKVARGRWMLEAIDPETGKFIHDNKFSVFKIRLEDGPRRDGRYGGVYIDESNLALLIREHNENNYDIAGPDNNVDYMQLVFKTAQGGEYSMTDWFNQPGSWKSEDGTTNYDELWMRMLLETWAFNKNYNLGVDYKKAMYDLSKLEKVYEDLLYLSQDTKIIFGVNLMQIIFGDALRYRQARSVPGGETLSADNRKGMATLTLFRVYHEGMADYDTLKKILGEDSDFFKLDTFIGNSATAKEGVSYAYLARQGKRIGMGEPPLVSGRTYFKPATEDLIEAAFDQEKRTIRNKDAFIRLINVFAQSDPDQAWQWVIRGALQQVVRKQFHVYHHDEFKFNPKTLKVERVGVDDGVSMSLSEADAWYFNLSMGGQARMDITPGGPVRNDQAVLMYDAAADRDKRFRLEGTPAGPADTIHKYKMLAAPPMDATAIQVVEPIYNSEREKIGEKVYQKSLLKLLGELQETANKWRKNDGALRGNEEELRAIEDQLAGRLTPTRTRAQLSADKARLLAEQPALRAKISEFDSAYKITLGTTHPYGEALREYFKKHWRPGKKEVDSFLKGEDFLSLGMFFSDSLYGINFEPEKFAKGIGGVIDRHKSQLHRFAGLPLAEMTRDYFVNPVTKQIQWIDIPRAAKMFDYDVLDHPAFRKKGSKPRLFRVAVPPDGRIRWKRFYELDFDKIDKNRVLLARLRAGHEIAEAIRHHLESKRGDTRYTKNFYVDAINSLKTIGNGFFTDEDIKWIRKKALSSDFWFFGMKNFGRAGFYLKWWLASAFHQKDDKESLFSKTFEILIAEMAKGTSF